MLESLRPLALALAALAGSAGAHDPAQHQGHAQHAAAAAPERFTPKLPDLALATHEGQRRRLASELVGEQIVVMDFIYTSCTTACPVVSALMAELQAKLGERAGSAVRLLSLSVDPARDTPARLAEFAQRYRSGPAWSWLTGSPQDIAAVLKSLGTYTTNFEDHPAVVMVGDGRSGEWTRYYGFPDPAVLLARVEQIAAARGRVAPLAAGHRHE